MPLLQQIFEEIATISEALERDDPNHQYTLVDMVETILPHEFQQHQVTICVSQTMKQVKILQYLSQRYQQRVQQQP